MSLPEPLSDLIPLFEEWSIPDVGSRVEKLISASVPELSSLVERVVPRIDAIDDYLASFGGRPFDEPALALMRLAECALDAVQELDSRAEG